MRMRWAHRREVVKTVQCHGYPSPQTARSGSGCSQPPETVYSELRNFGG